MIPRSSRFAVVAAGGFVVQITSVWLLTHTAHLSAAPATMAGVSLAVVHNFQWHRWWTWRDRPMRGAAAWVAFGKFVLANGVISMTGNTLLALATLGGVDVVVANVMAVGVCGVVNYALADRVVFTADAAPIGVRSCFLRVSRGQILIFPSILRVRSHFLCRKKWTFLQKTRSDPEGAAAGLYPKVKA